jgi:hypothetical protein
MYSTRASAGHYLQRRGVLVFSELSGIPSQAADRTYEFSSFISSVSLTSMFEKKMQETFHKPKSLFTTD